MSIARLIIGDVHDVLKTLPDDSVDLALTSPPFLALRSYLPADHPDKGKELGSEPTPGAFVDALLDVVEECARVLAPHGSLCIELGDTYAGSGGAGGDYNADGWRQGQPRGAGSTKLARVRKPGTQGEAHPYPILPDPGPKGANGGGWPQDKSLTLVPELFRIALAYGVNPLTGRTTEPWRIRNVVRHCRPNPPVGSLGDKWRPATSDWLVACTSRTRYWDGEATRGPASPNTHARTAQGVEMVERSGKSADRDGNWQSLPELHETAGAPLKDFWVLPTFPFKGAHYATFSPDVVAPFVKAMCPERVCRVCGEPSRRVVENPNAGQYGCNQFNATEAAEALPDAFPKNLNGHRTWDRPHVAERTTLGWTDCGHDGWRPGVVLDPFAGSGTTLAVATGHGRDAIGIDLDERNADLAMQRVGMFLTVEYHDGTDHEPTPRPTRQKYQRIHPPPPPGVDPKTWRPLAVRHEAKDLEP